MVAEGGCEVRGSGAGESAEVEAGGGGWGEQREVLGAAAEEAGREKSASERRRWETSCWRHQRGSSPF